MFRSKTDHERFDREFFSIYDTKTGIYRTPYLHVNKLDALRELDNLFRDPEHQKAQLVQNAEDFSLFKVGGYDTKTGEIRPIIPPEHIANLNDIRSAVARRDNRQAVATDVAQLNGAL